MCLAADILESELHLALEFKIKLHFKLSLICPCCTLCMPLKKMIDNIILLTTKINNLF